VSTNNNKTTAAAALVQQPKTKYEQTDIKKKSISQLTNTNFFQ